MMFIRFTSMLVILVLVGCSGSYRITDKQIYQTLEHYNKQANNQKQLKAAARDQGIYYLEIINPTAPLTQQLVSAKLDNAQLNRVVERLGINHVLRDVTQISSKVSAQFERLPLLQAMNILLATGQLQANLDGDVLIISRLPLLANADEDALVMKKYIFKHADTRDLMPVLKSLFANGDDDDDEAENPLRFALINEENAALVQGRLTKVRHTLKVLETLDTDTAHLLIEALVLELDVDQLIRVGNRISEGVSGKRFSNIGLDWGNTAGENITFSNNLAEAANSFAFKTAISLLIQNNYARLLSRPYFATSSGNKAKFEVVDDRYVTTKTSDGEVTLKPVSGGIIMEMTPFILPDEQVRIDLKVSSSSFSQTLDNVSLARSRSEVASTVHIALGKTFVVGGLLVEQSTKARAGFPGLNRLPGIGALFGSEKQTDYKRQVLILITPHLWTPGMDVPTNYDGNIEKIIDLQEKL